MNLRALFSFTLTSVCLGHLSAANSPTPATFDAGDVATARSLLETVTDAVTEDARALKPTDKDFRRRVAEAHQALGAATSQGEANAIIADVLASFDPRLRFHPPPRRVRVDYGWNWTIIGDAAFVTHIDRDGAASSAGLKLGDKVLTFDGTPLGRTNYIELYYAYYTLAPRPGLHIEVQSPGEAPRLLEIPAIFRPPYKFRSRAAGGDIYMEPAFSEAERKRYKEFRDPDHHLRRVGPVLIWQAEELHRLHATGPVLKAIRDAESLIIDLRGQQVLRYDPMLQILDGLFSESFEFGRIERARLDTALRVRGRDSSFRGMVIVLIDSLTGGFAEVLARVIQQKQRGVLIGDRTMGRVFEADRLNYANGAHFSFNLSNITVPVGEVILTDGGRLDGKGVPPDLLLLPKPEDISVRRDVVLAKALAMVKQAVSPEDAFKLIDQELDDDETM